jgi:Protein of unknown function (DUF3987)
MRTSSINIRPDDRLALRVNDVAVVSGLSRSTLYEALKPLHRLGAEARKANEAAAKDYEIEVQTFKLRKENDQKKGRAALKGGAGDISSLLATDEPEEPKARRYVVNDATYEALGVIVADNPNGTLAFRDELVSLLKNLDREEQISARVFSDSVERD